MSKAKTKEEMREDFLNQIRSLVTYWEKEGRRPDVKDKLDGLAFSILNILDGTSAGFPATCVVLCPHPDDKQYSIDQGEDWIENGTVINDDVMLHEIYYK